ncbi:hypothetical protein [Nocardiopsis sp. NRRL B-16309]|uniref:hypothetical protein n=1 Tax=Nocardiopsis sp. NRRL B-16309 TaxID=1519494 RepID=UPI0006AE4F65|nr:hypothetical protein [Nocardiopsis sp. NRRL B-16309]
MSSSNSLATNDALTLQWNAATTIHYRPDPVEIARRQDANAAPVTNWSALELLSALPVGEPVPEVALRARERHLIGSLPHGAALRDGATITRLAVRPLAVDVAVVTGPPAKAFNAATSFAPFCARAVHLTRLPDSKRDMYLTQASFYGVGVTVAGEELLAPVPYRPKRHTPAAWRFVELVHEKARQAGFPHGDPCRTRAA